MRTLLLTAILIPLITLALVHPWVGVLTWTWVSIMSPHRLTFGFTYNAPIAAAVAGATLVGMIVTRDRLRLQMLPVMWVLLAFILWMCITSIFAVHPNLIGPMFSKVMKIQLMIFVTLAVLHTRQHIQLFVWVIVISLGFYGAKGGIYTILTGGAGRVWGPPGSFIAGNNELALALTMTVPMMYYVFTQLRNRWLRLVVLAVMALTAFSILGTQSRGALLAIIAMSLYLWRFSHHKFAFAVLAVPFAILLAAFMPESWWERMRTILEWENDTSATGRINSWIMAYNLAKSRIIGGGFEVITPYLFGLYAPNPLSVKAAHSIYFQVLGEHGFIGLGLFLLIWLLTWHTATTVRRDVKGSPDLVWAATLTSMVKVSLIGYAVGGAFLSLAYFDLPYNMMIIVVLVRLYVNEQLKARAPAPSTAGQAAAMRGVPSQMPAGNGD